MHRPRDGSKRLGGVLYFVGMEESNFRLTPLQMRLEEHLPFEGMLSWFAAPTGGREQVVGVGATEVDDPAYVLDTFVAVFVGVLGEIEIRTSQTGGGSTRGC